MWRRDRDAVVHIHIEVDRELQKSMKLAALNRGLKLWEVWEMAAVEWLGRGEEAKR